ncbi:conserved hypothetical protein [Candida dubliniensis CD36]|uniref:Uncharacterized protein n=1 Tax=Candida dubliniensis (strain CD36 / ATCC MYA-646 / CBS 7987 / NCPF 3949 / NRRL Y-17841) TaxID=573826 RepID=B9WAB7_CANDC|nr:conserved hypothetical protein [Candida dubliniensis CD36]CAX43336.1 conserved hypothetical protein [Candida dubliniensis CD36]
MNRRFFSLIEQRVPAKYISFTVDDLKYDAQLEFVHCIQTVLPLNPYYVKTVLKEYIKHIESSNEDTSDELYESYCDPEVLNARELGPEQTDVIKYFISGFNQQYNGNDKDTITIKETPKLISGSNTTGLRTWEAALYLSNFLNAKDSPPYNLANKTVMEIGCGTGLVSLALAKNYHNIKKLIMTDGSTNVFDNLQETLRLNNLNDSSIIQCQQLIWGEKTTVEEHVDYLVAADITYDTRILDPLCQTIKDLFSNNNLQFAVIAATIRNVDTIKEWESKLDVWFSGKWSVMETESDPHSIQSNCWFNVNTPEIRIYEIHL